MVVNVLRFSKFQEILGHVAPLGPSKEFVPFKPRLAVSSSPLPSFPH